MSGTKPFHGASFCCTGIASKVREEISDKIVALGGRHYSDLMSDVNYLIVGSRDTEKYTYCIKKRHDIRFLKANSIREIHDKWIRGEEINMGSHMLGIFEDMNICLSRIEIKKLRRFFEEDFRKGTDFETFYNASYLEDLIKANGGHVSDSLVKSTSCVVTTEAKGKRYTKAVEWNVPVVNPTWLFDSFTRAASMKLDDYSLDLDSFNGCDVWREWLARKDKHFSDFSDIHTDSVAETKLRMRRNTKIWNSIMSNTTTSSRRALEDSTWDELPEEEEEALVPEVTKSTTTEEPKKNNLFLGLNFLMLGFTNEEQDILSKTIESNGGEITLQLDDVNITHILLPVQRGSQSSALLKVLPTDTKHKVTVGDISVITEWFLERSIFYNKVARDGWCFPLKGLKSFDQPNKFKICITGFTGIELLHIEKLIKYMNFEFCETLSNDRDLLIVNINLFKESLIKQSPTLFKYKRSDIIDCPIYRSGNTSVSLVSTKNKINAAKKWKIPIASVAYLWETLELSKSSTSGLTLPNLADYSWCLYAPNAMGRPSSLMDYMRTISNENLSTPRKKKRDDSVQDDDIRLPSPRSSTKKRKYGKISGSSSSASLTNKLVDAAEQNEDSVNIDEEAPSTQVGYEDVESARSKEELLQKLAGRKRRRA